MARHSDWKISQHFHPVWDHGGGHPAHLLGQKCTDLSGGQQLWKIYADIFCAEWSYSCLHCCSLCLGLSDQYFWRPVSAAYFHSFYMGHWLIRNLDISENVRVVSSMFFKVSKEVRVYSRIYLRYNQTWVPLHSSQIFLLKTNFQRILFFSYAYHRFAPCWLNCRSRRRSWRRSYRIQSEFPNFYVIFFFTDCINLVLEKSWSHQPRWFG